MVTNHFQNILVKKLFAYVCTLVVLNDNDQDNEKVIH